MIKLYASVLALTAAAFFSPGAHAQSEADERLEEIRVSSEQMKPPTKAPVAARGPAVVERPLSADEKRLNEIRIASEQMKPVTSQQFGAPASARAAEPKSAADLRADAIQESAEQMKPH